LFYFSEDVGAGLPLFTPKGEMLRYLMESYVREVQTRYGYQHVWTGHLVKETLYHKSGHYDNYRDSMFPPMVDGDTIFRLKPMNCPSHMTLFKEMGRHSYRELPMRFAEFATLYRYEDSGALSGLTRVRSLTQDDCHVFCTPDQIQAEFSRCLQLINEVLTAWIACRTTAYACRCGATKASSSKTTTNGSAPPLHSNKPSMPTVSSTKQSKAKQRSTAKADFLAKDALGREWQLSTVQVDFIEPERLGVEYVGEDGQMHTPVLIHRAVTGSTERFMGVMIEHYAGAFPLWLAPTQAVIIPISDEKHGAYAQEVQTKLAALGMRVELNMSRDRMNAKIRDAQLQNPYMLIIGDREASAGAVAVRTRTGTDLGALALDDFIARAQHEITTKA
jgi:threonyl-tRNA synthetase